MLGEYLTEGNQTQARNNLTTTPQQPDQDPAATWPGPRSNLTRSPQQPYQNPTATPKLPQKQPDPDATATPIIGIIRNFDIESAHID